jgi:hypothetical protein
MKVLSRFALCCMMTFFFGCDDPHEQPSAPSIINIEHTLINEVVVTFAKSVDPQNGGLRYDFYLNNKLVESVVDPEYDYVVFSNLLHSTDYEGSIIVTDGDGNVASANFQFTTGTPGPVYKGDLIVTKQEEIDIFPYTDIKGTLTIKGKDIRDLSKMSVLVNVEERLVIDNTAVKTLQGLENIYLNEIENVEPEGFIGKEMVITNNPNLQSIPTFNNIKRFELLEISNNDSLTNVDNFSNITEFVGLYTTLRYLHRSRLVISGNARLENVDGFLNVATFWNTNIKIHDNAHLMNLDGFKNAKFESIGSNIHFDSQTIFEVSENILIENYCNIVDLILSAGGRFHFFTRENAFNPTHLDIAHGYCSE